VTVRVCVCAMGIDLPPLICRRAHILFVFVAYSGVQLVLTVHMKNMAGVLSVAGTSNPSWAPEFTPAFWRGPCCSSL
jgi:hypothetical protein